MSNILGDSIKMSQSNTDFLVFVIDGFDKNALKCDSRYKCISVSDMGIHNLNELAFKYDLTEFCTAIKPKSFDYIFKLGYDKAIYLDPDIYVFSCIDDIFKKLDDHPICIAPHIIYPEINYTGHWPQGRILAAGVYNLGFIGVRRTDRSMLFIKWWNNNLEQSCFNERSEGYFTDQKWINFCPVYFPETLVMRDLGVDVALWNIHEREIVVSENHYSVKRRGPEFEQLDTLYFFHFSNFNFRHADTFEDFIPFSLGGTQDIVRLSDFYRVKLLESGFISFNKIPDYKYNYFSNGVHINKIHRRLYRRLLDNGIKFEDPFSVDENSFYWQLKKNKLIANEKMNYDNMLLRAEKHSSSKFNMVKSFIRFGLRLIGLKRYTFLCRFLLWFSKYENQLFLIKDYDKYIDAKAPDGYINIKD